MTRPFMLTPDLAAKPRPKGFWRGKNAQRSGSNFQKSIDQAAAMQRSIVALHGLPSLGAKRIAGGAFVPTKICCDFVGAFVGFVGLFFDAKSTGDEALDLRVMIFEKKGHQLTFLRKMNAAGQVAGYMVEARLFNRYLWLDVAHVHEHDTSLKFYREGQLCRQFFDLGPMTSLVPFEKLRAKYEVSP